MTTREQELEEALRSLEAEYTQFTYRVSHDIRAPLRAIRQYADFLKEDLRGRLGGEQERYLDELGNAVDEAELMVERLLELSRVGRNPSELIGLRSSDLTLLVQENFIESGEIILDFPGDLPPLYVRREPLVSIIKELVGNALKFNRSNPKKVEVGCRFLDGIHQIYVRDNGIGIEEKFQDRVFGVFEKLHGGDEYEGTGMGLAIVKRAAEVLGCEVWLESSPGKGSTFHVAFPSDPRKKNETEETENLTG